MANDNTIFRIVNSPAQTINAATETSLLNSKGAPIALAIEPNTGFEAGRTFRVRIIGKCAGGTGATLALGLYVGAPLTGTKIAAFTVSGAAIPTAGGNFSVFADLTWDVVSQKLTGNIGGQTNGTLSSGATTVATVATVAGLTFSPTATFGAALSTNTVTVTEFTIEQV